MRKIFIFILIFCYATSFALQNIYIKHVFAKGETIYSISKLYDVSIDEIKNMNPGLDISKVKIGESINIPLKEKGVNVSNNSNKSSSISTNTSVKYHTVKSGESLYSLAKKYSITLADLNKWNKIENNSIKIGQVLKVSEPMIINKQTDLKTNANPNINTQIVDIDVTDPTNRESSKTIENKPAVTNSIKPAPIQTNSNYVNDYYNSKTIASGKKEKGIGMSMLDSGDNPSYIALYSGASIGSMIQVKNLMNGKIITAKVIGKIPSLDRNKDVLVKISGNAYNELGALDEKFLVEVIY